MSPTTECIKNGATHVIKKTLRAITRPEWCFLIIVLIVGSCFAILTPAGAGADEPSHIARTISIAHGNIMADKITDRKGFTSPKDINGIDAALYGGWIDSSLTDVAWHNMTDFFTPKSNNGKLYTFPTWQTKGMMTNQSIGQRTSLEPFSNTAVNSPFVYIPFIIGYWTSKAFTNNAYATIIIMRLFGLLFSSAILFYCIRTIPIGKWAIATISLMPMMIIFNTTITADTMTYAMCIWFITEIFQCACMNRELSKSQWTTVALTSISLALIKLSYIPLIILLILIPLSNRFARTRNTILGFGIIGVLTVVLFIGWYFAVGSINTGAMFNVGASPTFQKRYLITHLQTYGMILLKQFVGQNFFNLGASGPFNAHGHPDFSGWITILTLICASLHADPRETRLRVFKEHAITYCGLILFVSICVFGLVETALYLQFSPVGAANISGVQSRYFLPILPLLIIGAIITYHCSNNAQKQSSSEERYTQHHMQSDLNNRVLSTGAMLCLQLLSAAFSMYLLYATLYIA